MHRNLEPIFYNIHDRKFYRLFTAKNNHTFFEVSFNGGDGEGNQDWQDTLIEGSDLTRENIIEGGGFNFFWNSLRHYINKTVDADNPYVNIGFGTNEIGLKLTSSRNTSYLFFGDENTAGNGGLDAVNVWLYNKDGTRIMWITGRWLEYGSDAPVQLLNGEVYVNNSGSTKSLILQSNTIVSWNDPLIFKYQSGVSTAVAHMAMSATGQFSIGTTTPNTSAKLQINSTTQGVLLPRMTKAERNAITVTIDDAGLAIYQTDNTPGLRVYNGVNWIKYSESTD